MPGNTAGSRLRYVPLKPDATPVAVGAAYRDALADVTLRTFLDVARAVK